MQAQKVLDLYAREWDGKPLGRNDYVISADESARGCGAQPFVVNGAFPQPARRTRYGEIHIAGSEGASAQQCAGATRRNLLLHCSTQVVPHNDFDDFDDLDVVVERLAAFETRYNQAAKPFKWKFTTTDLADLMDRLDRHRPGITTDPAQPNTTPSRLTPDELAGATTKGLR